MSTRAVRLSSSCFIVSFHPPDLKKTNGSETEKQEKGENAMFESVSDYHQIVQKQVRSSVAVKTINSSDRLSYRQTQNYAPPGSFTLFESRCVIHQLI